MLQAVKNGENIDSFLLNIKRPSYYQKIQNLSCNMQVKCSYYSYAANIQRINVV